MEMNSSCFEQFPYIKPGLASCCFGAKEIFIYLISEPRLLKHYLETSYPVIKTAFYANVDSIDWFWTLILIHYRIGIKIWKMKNI